MEIDNEPEYTPIAEKEFDMADIFAKGPIRNKKLFLEKCNQKYLINSKDHFIDIDYCIIDQDELNPSEALHSQNQR